MPPPIPLIDHAIVNARQALDESASLWMRLGFTVTPRGNHTLGSSNNLSVFGTDYVELLGTAEEEDRADILSWPAGLNGLVFKTTDADALYQALSDAGAPVLPPQDFSRPVDFGTGKPSGKAAFRVVRLERDAFPAARLFFCEHLNPGLVWHDPWRRHPNGVTGIAGMLIAAEDVEAVAALFAHLFGEASIRRTPSGILLAAGLASIEVTDPQGMAARLGEAAPAMDRPALLAGLTLRTTSLAQARAALEKGGIARPPEAPLVLPPDLVGGFALSFIE